MIDMHRGGRTTSWRYVRVRRVVPGWDTGEWAYYEELGEVEGITSFDMEESTESSLKVSGSIEYVDMPDMGDDLLRVYADMELDGEEETICYGTFFVHTGEEEITEGSRTGSADLYSVLSVLDRELLNTGVSIASTLPCTAWARETLFHANLPAVITDSAKCSASGMTWDAGTSLLEMINDMMDVIGYSSANVDAYGNVIIRPYETVSDKAPTTYFSDTLDDVSDSTIKREFDTYDVPNVVVVMCSAEDGTTYTGTATNADPMNPYSTVSRNMEITRVEQVDGLESDAECKAKADLLLREGMQKVETFVIPHAGKRFSVGDAATLDYQRSNLSGKFNAYKRSIKATPDIESETTLRRTVNLYAEV